MKPLKGLSDAALSQLLDSAEEVPMNTDMLLPSLWCRGEQWRLTVRALCSLQNGVCGRRDPPLLMCLHLSISVYVSLQRTFTHNEVIIQEGDEGRTFFFILRGQVGFTCSFCDVKINREVSEISPPRGVGAGGGGSIKASRTEMHLPGSLGPRNPTAMPSLSWAQQVTWQCKVLWLSRS